MITILAFFVPIFFLFLYQGFFSLEIAASLQARAPTHFGVGFSVTPIWELTNVFLIFALVSVMAFFPSAISNWAPLVAIPALIFLTIQAIRACAMAFVFYDKKASGVSKTTLALTSILSPAFLIGGFLPPFLIGASAFSRAGFPLAIVLGIGGACASFVTAILFLNARHMKNNSSKILFWFWILVLAAVWTLVIIYKFPNLSLIASMIAPAQTVEMLLVVCILGIIVAVPGIGLLYYLFL